MRGDVTRQTFRSGKHYRSVLQQQGRVALDADWNEQADIQAYLDRTVAADLVGDSGAPRRRPGMAIVDKDGKKPEKVADDGLFISAGHYYVDGILCENGAAVPLTAQPDLPGVDLQKKPDGTYVAYLDVWFEHLTALDRPELREVALGGPDTTTRARTIWQVRLRKDGDPEPANPAASMLAEAVVPAEAKPTPCVVGPTAGYRRLENQLYRIEVFDPSGAAGGPSFLWSRENGSVVAVVTDIKVVTDPATKKDTVSLTIAAQGRDDRLAFHADDWVEVTDLGTIRRGDRGYLAKLATVAGTLLTAVDGRGTAPTKPDPPNYLVVRRWDATKEQTQPQLIPNDETPVAVEGGVQVTFGKDGVYRTGDYWLVPARTANLEGTPTVADLAGNVDWPRDKDGKALFEPPAGVVHHYADIARLTRAGGVWTVEDLRPIFDPLTDPFDVDVTMAGGDGQESLPGVALDEPLRVAVTRNRRSVKGATVRFTTADDDALLVSPDPNAGGAGVPHQVDVETDAEGVASCGWQLGPKGRPSQQVTARLLDADDEPTGPPLVFTASLSRADRVAFDPGTCAAMDGATTVQSALLRLAGAPVLVPVGGDGQIATADATLESPVRVLVRGCGAPLPSVTVRFAITEGGVARVGGTPSAPSVDLSTDGSGVVECLWQLGRDVPLQTLTATLLRGNDPDPRAVPLTFVAGVAPSALTVERVELPAGTELTNGATVAVGDLVGGATVVLGAAPEPVVPDGPALRVTLDLPFPVAQSDRDLWSIGFLGTLPLGLDGTVAVNDAPAVTWSPSVNATAFLNVLFGKLRDVDAERVRVRGHLRVAGNVLGRAAADVTRWFWLTEKLVDLVVVPNEEKLLQGWARRAVALSLAREELRGQLPAGVTVADVPRDIAGAGAAAKRIFGEPGQLRALRLVVDARYTAAGEAVKRGLAEVEVDMELLPADDPVTEVTTRVGNGEDIDGVLTDAVSAAAVKAVKGFTKSVPL